MRIFDSQRGKTFFNETLPFRKNLAKDWRDDIRQNDILITKSGDLRVVREALYYADETLRSVKFAIRKCSWTKHPTTSYDRSQLKSLGFRKAAVKFKPKKHDEDFQQYILSGKDTSARHIQTWEYTCFNAKDFA
jgi:hypothetical protein